MSAAHALNANLSISGNYSFQVTGNQVDITVDRIGNSSSTYTSGSLRLELWATSAPYTGGGISGYQTASIRTVEMSGLSDSLGSNAYFSGIQATLPFAAPAPGYDYYTLILTEYSSSCTASDNFCIAAYGSFGSSSSKLTFGGVVVNQLQQPISGATVTLTASGKTFSAVTDAAGLFSITFDKTGLPTAMAAILSKAGYAPVAFNLNISSSSSIDLGTLAMEPLGPALVLFDLVPELHHLGDGSFSGTINSLFQMNVEGSSYSKTFTLSAEQMTATGATITLLAKGLQCQNTLSVNGHLIAYLNNSPADGSFQTETINVPRSNFVLGSNTFSIVAGSCSSSDLDDFEFTNGKLRFSGITASNAAPFLVTVSEIFTATKATLSTKITFNAPDVGSQGAVFVTAMVPPGSLTPASSLMTAVGSAAATAGGAYAAGSSAATAATAFVLIQLTPSGWQAVVDGKLIPYSNGVLGDLLASQTILNNADATNLKGAKFCLGYGITADEMLAAGRMLTVSTIPDPAATNPAPVTCLFGVPLTLSQGWNLLGNSAGVALDVAKAFGDPAKVTSVWKWIPDTQKWAFYSPSMSATALADYAASKSYAVLSTADAGAGIWVNAVSAFTSSLALGAPVTAASFQSMGTGWNLIAIGESKTPSQFNALAAPTTPLTSLWAWDGGLGNWYFYAPNLASSGGLANYIGSKGYLDFTTKNKTLGPGTGFWVNKP